MSTQHITITIETGNDAFGEGAYEGAQEVARILSALAAQLKSSDLDDISGAKLRDYNGNTVGSIVVGPVQLQAPPAAFYQLPPVDWSATYDRMTNEQRHHEERAATTAAQMGARAASYLYSRLMNRTHGVAVRNQNSMARKVRRALGFTVPNDPFIF